MKKLFFAIPILSLFAAACSNDFEVTAPWKEVPVAYGILSARANANYIRVEKAFLDPERGATVISQIPDSIYYPESAISVSLMRVSTNEKFPLTRVDGNLEGFKRDSGLFATSPNWLYKLITLPGTPQRLVTGEKYRLIIHRNNGKPDVTAETTVPRDFTFSSPDPSKIPPILAFLNDKNTGINWRGDLNSAFFNVSFIIRFREEAPNGTVLAHRTISWTAGEGVKRGETTTTNSQGIIFYNSKLDIPSSQFFQMLADSIPVASDRVRYFEDCDVIIEGGGSEIETFLQTESANSGLTGSEIVTTYSNLSEGYGIFTAKNVSTLAGVHINQLTIDNMNDNPITKALNFKFF